MYTRCSGCHTVHPVNASLLAQGSGQFRCGKCKKVCNALDSLFDEWPGAGERPAKAGELPVLGMSIDLEKAKSARLIPDEAVLTGDAPEAAEPVKRQGWRLARITWIILALVIAVALALQLSEFLGKPILDLPAVQAVKSRLGIGNTPVAKPFRDLDQIQLVRRELKSHPFETDQLQLTATIVNLADRTQPYPDLEVVLLNAGGQELNRIRFSPRDYLAKGKSRRSGMTPKAYLPLVLDLPDPGQAAVGFELIFL